MFKKVITQSLAAILLVFSGCGDSDSATPSAGAGSNEPSQTVSGTVATGEGALATITLVGSLGNTMVGNSSANGYYTVDASGLTQPIMVKAVLDRDGSTMYSFASSTSGTVNVTPLTTFVVDQAAVATGVTGGASQLFTQFEEATPPEDTEQEVDDSTQELNIAIATAMEANGAGGFDHFSDDFDANHDGYDAVLDDLDIEVYEDDIIIRTDDAVLDTLNYDISTSEINASGSIYDIATNLPIEDVNITMVDSAGQSLSTSTDVNGDFSIAVQTMRVYDVTITANGYDTQFVPNIPSFVFSETSVGEIPMFPEGTTGTTTLSGVIIDGRTSSTGIDGVSLTFRDGYGDRITSAIATAVTDMNGSYSVELPIGVYTVEMTHDDYYSVFRDIDVFGTTGEHDFSMLGDMSDINTTSFFATVTLNWDENPSDLDSHLTGPIPNSQERFHMAYYNAQIDADENASEEDYFYEEQYTYQREQLEIITGEDLSSVADEGLYTYYYENLTSEQQTQMDNVMEDYYSGEVTTTPCSNGELASLDRDRTSSYSGLLPETTTICNVENGGLYKYYVHHFSGDSTMNEGNAQVTVATRNGISRTFNAPSTNSIGNDDIWHVFNIDSDGNIYPVNEIIGNDYDDSELFAAPSRNSDSRFSADVGIFSNLPSK